MEAWFCTCSASSAASAAALCALLLCIVASLPFMLSSAASWVWTAAVAVCSSSLLFCKGTTKASADLLLFTTFHIEILTLHSAETAADTVRAHPEVLLCFCVVLLLLIKFLLKGCTLSQELIHLGVPVPGAILTADCVCMRHRKRTACCRP